MERNELLVKLQILKSNYSNINYDSNDPNLESYYHDIIEKIKQNPVAFEKEVDFKAQLCLWNISFNENDDLKLLYEKYDLRNGYLAKIRVLQNSPYKGCILQNNITIEQYNTNFLNETDNNIDAINAKLKTDYTEMFTKINEQYTYQATKEQYLNMMILSGKIVDPNINLTIQQMLNEMKEIFANLPQHLFKYAIEKLYSVSNLTDVQIEHIRNLICNANLDSFHDVNSASEIYNYIQNIKNGEMKEN
jgi:hypothetical protein